MLKLFWTWCMNEDEREYYLLRNLIKNQNISSHLNWSDPWADVLLSLLEAKLVLAESPWLAAVVKCSVL